MKILIDLLQLVYAGAGYSFTKEITLPILGRHSVTLIVTAKSPAQFSFTMSAEGGLIKFEKNGPRIHVKEFGLETTVTGISFTAEKAIFQLSGFPDLSYTFPKE